MVHMDELEQHVPPSALRFALTLTALHSLIQVAGAQEPEKVATAAVALADATLRRFNGEPEPAEAQPTEETGS
jgi:hypothetical protein